MNNHQTPKLDEAMVARAIDAWMDKKFAIFGKWTASSLLVLVFGAFCKWYFAHGFQT
jgi:hypothetical protein